MKNNITEVVFILDRSGSMGGCEEDTIGGFNATLERQRKLDGQVYVSTVLFDHETTVLHDRVPIADVPNMTEKDYQVRGSTALLDAVGGAVRHIEKVHRYIRPEDVPEHTVFIITTDGMENASHTYSGKDVKKMIEAQTEKGWEFIFMAADLDAVAVAEDIGIRKERAVNFTKSKKGLAKQYCAMADAIETVACGKSLDGGAWRTELDK